MADPFEVLLSLGSGFASGAVRRKRENELIQLEQKEKEQKARQDRIGSIEGSLLTLFSTGQFSPESLQSAFSQVGGLVDRERGGQAIGELETLPPSTPQPKQPKLSEKASILNSVRQARNLGQISEKESVAILRQGGFSEKEIGGFKIGRQPHKTGGSKADKRLSASDRLVDNIRTRLAPLESKLKTLDEKEATIREDFSDLSSGELEAEIAKQTGLVKPQRRRLRSQVQALQNQEKKALREQIKASRAVGVNIGLTQDEKNQKVVQLRGSFQQKKITAKQFARETKPLMTPTDYKSFLISLVSTGELSADEAEKLLPEAGEIK